MFKDFQHTLLNKYLQERIRVFSHLKAKVGTTHLERMVQCQVAAPEIKKNTKISSS